jgi:hypothetical protein
MAAKVFTAPKEVKVPEFSFETLDTYEEECENYIENLKAFLKERGWKHSGQVIQFPVADGYAKYMVMSMNPLQLIHLELGDAWHFQHINLMTAQAVQEMVDTEKRMRELFKK